jgi:two-component system sensor histidine kinase KdpD
MKLKKNIFDINEFKDNLNKILAGLNVEPKEREIIFLTISPLINRVSDVEEESKKHIEHEKEKLRGQILSSVSHDLKTPLAAIIGSLNILTSMGSKITDIQKIDLLKTSASEAHRLNNFINNILNMARIESGVIKPKKEWFSVRDIALHAKKTFREKYPDRVIQVTEINHNLQMNTDPALFEQIMLTILDNAVKYSPPETDITLSIEKNISLDFLIRDKGNGIEKNMLEKIFDKYTRLEMGDRKTAGTGLGLAIARSLAILQNINITASNHQDGGAVFKVSCFTWRQASDENRDLEIQNLNPI